MIRVNVRSGRDRRITGAVALLLTLAIVLLAMVSPVPASVQADASASSDSPAEAARGVKPMYVLVAWNDLGMHCMNVLFRRLALLPPYNTMWAQLIVRGNPPEITAANVSASYSVRGKTDSVGETDFRSLGKSSPMCRPAIYAPRRRSWRERG